ncbi:Ger(x)C family spore germination protein [Rossellomorea aquimaris]|uniref:Ger(x)C family spore germination protein n=1 Tax=Rossellomorea aquimaris TaxID=189382 RepID=UPI0007D08581|nr:Ger(x)C family spore germination protein [Rossellomorea aquimaris]
MKDKVSNLLIFILFLFLTGCTGSKNIQDLTYIVTIGIDYNEENEEYTAYLQGLNFANVAKQEGNKPSEPIPTFIGSAKGETLNLAVKKLYKASRPSLFFGHTKSLVVSKNVLKYKYKEVLEDIGRNRSLRPTLQVFTTDENIEEIFKVKGLFNYPPVYTVLLTEKTTESLKDEIGAVSLMEFLREYYEPMGSALIPIIKINNNYWQSDVPYPSLYLDGYSVFQHSEFKGDLSSKESIMVDWLFNKNTQLNYPLYHDGKLISTYSITSKKPKITYKKSETEFPNFSIEVHVQAELIEKIKDVPYEEAKKELEVALKKEINRVYSTGLDKGVDLLNVGKKWYRYHPNRYKDIEEAPYFYLKQDSLERVEVTAKITHFNAYRYGKK